MNKLYIAALLQLALACSPTYASSDATQSSAASEGMPQAISGGTAGTAGAGVPDIQAEAATQAALDQYMQLQNPSKPVMAQSLDPKDMLTPEQYKEHTASLEKQIEQILATYPATYKARPNSFRIHTITATNPDTGDSIADIKNVTFHRNFKPEQAFSSAKFNQACAVQWKTKTGTMNGYISSATEKNKNAWDITLVALTKDHPTHEAFPDTAITIPQKNQQVNVTVSPLSKEEIRKQLRMQFFGPESAPRNKHKRNN
ncbi:MAG: hypothetical protein WCJ17_00440 [bacterium]|jgi:hypothetical protein